MEFQERLDRKCCITYGIFPPLECEIEAPFDSTDLMEWSFSITCGIWISIQDEEEVRKLSKALASELIDKTILA